MAMRKICDLDQSLNPKVRDFKNKFVLLSLEFKRSTDPDKA